MVLSSSKISAVEEGKKPDETAEVASEEDIVPEHPPSFFTDEEGNLKFVNFIVRYPCLVFWLVLAMCVVITILLANIVFAAGNPITESSSNNDIYDIRSVAYDSFRFAKEEVGYLRAEKMAQEEKALQPVEPEKPVRRQENYADVTYWIYESKVEGGVFSSRDSIKVMREAETMFTNHADYPKYCWLSYDTDAENSTSSCRRPFSALNIYYASEWNSTVAKYVIDQLSPENVELYNDMAACIEYNMFCQFLPPSITPQDIMWARGLHFDIMSMMYHWDGKGQLNNDIDEVTLFVAHIKDLVTKSPYVSFFFDSNFTVANPVSMHSRSMVYWGSPLEGFEDEEAVTSSRTGRTSSRAENRARKKYIIDNFLEYMDMIASKDHNPYIKAYYFQGVLIFDVIIQILIQDALKAILSFWLVFFYLRLMVGSSFLAVVGMAEIIFSLPIAWFFFSAVFQVGYFSSLNVLCLFIVAAIGADDIFVFMDAYKQSAHKGKRILRSLESRMSWVYRRSGTAMAITSATTCSAFLCTISSPIASTQSFGIFAALVIFFDYVLVMTLFCTAVVVYHNYFEQGCCTCSEENTKSTEQAIERIGSGEAPKEDKISFFFRTKFSSFILKPRNRLIIAIPVFIWVVIASICTSRVQPTQTTEQALDKDHPLQRGATILSEKFARSEQDRGTKILFVWGIDEVDRDGVNQLLDPEYTGSPRFKESFTFNEECQKSMLETCDAFKTDDQYEPYIKRKDGGLRSVQCFVEELGAYNSLNTLKNCEAVKNGEWKNTTWEVSPADLEDSMADFLKKQSCYGDGKTMLRQYPDEVGWDGSALRYAGISFESPVLSPYGRLAEDIVREQYDEMITISSDLDSKMEEKCGSNVIMTDLNRKFIFMNNQKIYRTSAVSGSMIGVAIAFVVLLISTRLVHIAFFATISILCVLVSVIGAVYLMGWTLGTNEAILISILAGFSVDYVVHLAHAYVSAEGSTADRLTEAFGDMGISVFSGMLTSVVASIPLFLCTLTFFAKFGTFLCLTIAFSWCFANFGFMSAIAQAKIPVKKEKKDR